MYRQRAFRCLLSKLERYQDNGNNSLHMLILIRCKSNYVELEAFSMIAIRANIREPRVINAVYFLR